MPSLFDELKQFIIPFAEDVDIREEKTIDLKKQLGHEATEIRITPKSETSTDLSYCEVAVKIDGEWKTVPEHVEITYTLEQNEWMEKVRITCYDDYDNKTRGTVGVYASVMSERTLSEMVVSEAKQKVGDR